MGNKSPIHINLHNAPQDRINEEDSLLEEFAQYYVPAYYPIAQLACFHLPCLQEATAKICSKISPAGNTSLHFRLLSSPDGISLEILPSESPTIGIPSTHQDTVAQGFEKALASFLNTAIPKIVTQQMSDDTRMQIGERFQRAQQRLAEEMIRHMAEQQRRWIKACAERRDYARHLEKSEREKDEIKKEEEKRQELRLAIQRIEEPKRQSQRMCIQKEETNKAFTRKTLSKPRW
jgi:hypothetical protein